MTRLIFILSMPRAGSTLLQRLLMADGCCTSIGEHSLLLRFLGEDAVVQRRATYGERLIETSLRDLRAACPGFDEVYRSGVHQLAMDVYDRLAGDKPWFLDKTPRYHLICEELIQTFPEAKFLILWRHPLAVAASMVSTFRKDEWTMDEFGIDLHAGMERLLAFSRKHADSICQVRYEDLVAEPGECLRRIGAYLGWDHLERVLEDELPAHNNGRLGDPTGGKKYSNVSSGSKDAWADDYHNWFRRAWAAEYFSGERGRAFEALGYTLPANLSEGKPANLLAGAREWLRAAKRRRRKITHAEQPTRYCREFHEKHGYHIHFS